MCRGEQKGREAESWEAVVPASPWFSWRPKANSWTVARHSWEATCSSPAANVRSCLRPRNPQVAYSGSFKICSATFALQNSVTAYVSKHPQGRPEWVWMETAEPPGGVGQCSRLIVKLLQSADQEWNTVLKNTTQLLSLKAILLAHKGRSELHHQSIVITELKFVLE